MIFAKQKRFSAAILSILVCVSCLVLMTACDGGTVPPQGGSGNITSELGAAYEKECIAKINGARDGLPELQNDPALAKEALAALDKITDGKIAWGDALKEEYSGTVKTSVLYVATDVGFNERPNFIDVMVNATELTEAHLEKLSSTGTFAGKTESSVTYAAKYFARVGVATKEVDGKTYAAMKVVASQDMPAKDPNK